jgi:hypothetical protein
MANVDPARKNHLLSVLPNTLTNMELVASTDDHDAAAHPRFLRRAFALR